MKADTLTAKADFIHTFIEKLGDVANWNHSGVVVDSGKGSTEKCVCGHPIRYLYKIDGPEGKVAQVGSECINHFKDYNESLYNALISTVERLKEDEKKAKELLILEEVEVIRLPYEDKVKKVFNWYRETYGNRWCSDYGAWKFVKELSSKPKKDYTNKKSLLNWYVKNEASVSRFIEEKRI